MVKQELEIYIHIPFCAKKCEYCDFLSFPQYNNAYVPALIQEIKNAYLEGKQTKEYRVKTIFIGGGTPSILNGEEIASILQQVYDTFDVDPKAEITIEVNPGTITKEKLKHYMASGINRISMGLQSTNNNELKELGRIHTYDEFVSNYELARNVGFDNINIDLMSAIPLQTMNSWKDTLNKVVALTPEHISAYSLIIEEGTSFFNKWNQDLLVLPLEEEERQMYYDTKEILKQAGYQRYEISNYSKAGYECKHNIGYWKRADYIGFGLGASSLIQNKRFTNETNLESYIQITENRNAKLHQNVQALTQIEEMEEFMFLGLRLTEGISLKEFSRLFQKEYMEIYGAIHKKLTYQGLLKEKEGRISLTDMGLDVSNHVMSEFLLS